jgi:hypothetical protein
LTGITLSSRPHGITASGTEVTNITGHGVWQLVADSELFMAYDDFHWFKDAPVGKVQNVEEPGPGHFYWPELDIDVGLEIIENPDISL